MDGPDGINLGLCYREWGKVKRVQLVFTLATQSIFAAPENIFFLVLRRY